MMNFEKFRNKSFISSIHVFEVEVIHENYVIRVVAISNFSI